MTASPSKRITWVVKLPKQKTRVRFENLDSYLRYCADLKKKNIEHECHRYFEES